MHRRVAMGLSWSFVLTRLSLQVARGPLSGYGIRLRKIPRVFVEFFSYLGRSSDLRPCSIVPTDKRTEHKISPAELVMAKDFAGTLDGFAGSAQFLPMHASLSFTSSSPA